MRTLFFLFVIMWFVPDVLGQQVSYSYDDAGNRIQRTIFLSNQQSSSSGDDTPRSRAEVKETDISEMPRYEDMLGERKVVIYPNPTRGMLQIEFQGYGEMKDARIILYNMQVRLLLQVNNIESYTTLDLTPYPAGAYILHLMEGMKRSEWKIIKQ